MVGVMVSCSGPKEKIELDKLTLDNIQYIPYVDFCDYWPEYCEELMDNFGEKFFMENVYEGLILGDLSNNTDKSIVIAASFNNLSWGRFSQKCSKNKLNEFETIACYKDLEYETLRPKICRQFVLNQYRPVGKRSIQSCDSIEIYVKGIFDGAEIGFILEAELP